MFTSHVFNEHLVCARHWEYRREVPRHRALMVESTLGRAILSPTNLKGSLKGGEPESTLFSGHFPASCPLPTRTGGLDGFWGRETALWVLIIHLCDPPRGPKCKLWALMMVTPECRSLRWNKHRLGGCGVKSGVGCACVWLGVYGNSGLCSGLLRTQNHSKE